MSLYNPKIGSIEESAKIVIIVTDIPMPIGEVFEDLQHNSHAFRGVKSIGTSDAWFDAATLKPNYTNVCEYDQYIHFWWAGSKDGHT